MTATDPADVRIAAEDAAARAVPEHVLDAVAEAVLPSELGAPGTASSELVHRVMRVTYEASQRRAVAKDDECARCGHQRQNHDLSDSRCNAGEPCGCGCFVEETR